MWVEAVCADAAAAIKGQLLRPSGLSATGSCWEWGMVPSGSFLRPFTDKVLCGGGVPWDPQVPAHRSQVTLRDLGLGQGSTQEAPWTWREAQIVWGACVYNLQLLLRPFGLLINDSRP